jgi:hypothetical protein
MTQVNEELRMAYVECFSTPAGRKVFAHILMNICAYFGEIRTEDDRIRHNVGADILGHAGLGVPRKFEPLLNAWIELPEPAEYTEARK